MTIRRVRDGEGAKLRELRLRALRSDPGAFAATAKESAARPREHWESWAEVVFVADEGDAWAGMVAGRRAGDPASAWLFALWVDPAERGTGLGARLIEAVADWARAQGAAALELSVTTNNPAAAALYARTGFAETGRRRPLPADPSRTEVFLRREL